MPRMDDKKLSWVFELVIIFLLCPWMCKIFRVYVFGHIPFVHWSFWPSSHGTFLKKRHWAKRTQDVIC